MTETAITSAPSQAQAPDKQAFTLLPQQPSNAPYGIGHG